MMLHCEGHPDGHCPDNIQFTYNSLRYGFHPFPVQDMLNTQPAHSIPSILSSVGESGAARQGRPDNKAGQHHELRVPTPSAAILAVCRPSKRPQFPGSHIWFPGHDHAWATTESARHISPATDAHWASSNLRSVYSDWATPP